MEVLASKSSNQMYDLWLELSILEIRSKKRFIIYVHHKWCQPLLLMASVLLLNPHIIKRALCLSRSFELNVKLLDREKVL